MSRLNSDPEMITSKLDITSQQEAAKILETTSPLKIQTMASQVPSQHFIQRVENMQNISMNFSRPLSTTIIEDELRRVQQPVSVIQIGAMSRPN